MAYSKTTYDKLLVSLRYWLLGREFYTALKAPRYAADYHTGLRKDGVTPEFEHQLRIVSEDYDVQRNLNFWGRALVPKFEWETQ